MYIGEKIGHLAPSLQEIHPRPAPSKVVYIHPENRFFVVAFYFDNHRTFRESFPMDSKAK